MLKKFTLTIMVRGNGISVAVSLHPFFSCQNHWEEMLVSLIISVQWLGAYKLPNNKQINRRKDEVYLHVHWELLRKE